MNFEEIEKEGSTLNQGEFYKFCTDFQLPLSKIVFESKLIGLGNN